MKTRRSPLLVIVMTGIFGGLTFLATFFLGIPYAGGAGYFSFGDALALLATYLFGPIVGLGSSLLGAVFADLAKGYAAFIPFTILAKSIMILSAYGISYSFKNKGKWHLLGFFIGGAFMPLGYLPIYLWLYQEFAWVSLGFDLLQGLGCAGISFLLYFPLKAALPENLTA